MKLRICILLVVILLISFCSKSNMSSEELINYFQKRGNLEVSNKIVIVDVSDQSFEELGRLPFPIEYYDKLIKNLNVAGAELIVFDMGLDRDTIDKLGRITNHSNIVLNGYFNLHDEPSIKDTSGMICYYPIFLKENKEDKLSLGINVLRKLISNNPDENDIKFNNGKKFLEIGNFEIPKYSDNQILLNYYGPAKTFPYYSIDAVLDDNTFQVYSERDFGYDLNLFNDLRDKGVFKNKIVLIGTSADELHDLYYTPMYSMGRSYKYGLMPGVEILANFLEMVIHNNYIGVQKNKQVKNSEKNFEIDESDKEVNEALIEHGKKLLEKGKKELHKGD